jgi:hypothetical protein
MNLAGETEVLGGNLPRRHFVHHKIPHNDSVSNPGPLGSQGLWRGAQELKFTPTAKQGFS